VLEAAITRQDWKRHIYLLEVRKWVDVALQGLAYKCIVYIYWASRQTYVRLNVNASYVDEVLALENRSQFEWIGSSGDFLRMSRKSERLWSMENRSQVAWEGAAYVSAQSRSVSGTL